MNQDKNKKKGSPLGAIIFFIIIFLFGMADEAPGLLAGIIVTVVILFVLYVVFRSIAIAAKRQQSQNMHTHDRIDHSRDLKVNPVTGQSQRPTVQRAAHSPREHWKMQLDALLENGTIDRKEYRALMNRKF